MVSDELKAAFFEAGYNKEQLVDLVIASGLIHITNMLHNITDVEIDFPLAEDIQ